MIEIERRFLVPVLPTELPVPQRIEQFYIGNIDGLAIRVRFVDDVFHCITFKRNVRHGTNFEMGYDVKAGQDELLAVLKSSTSPRIRKNRYHIPFGDLVIELDEISKDGAWVAIAEIELPSIDHDLGELPPWIGEEITGQQVWSNASIAKFGFPTL